MISPTKDSRREPRLFYFLESFTTLCIYVVIIEKCRAIFRSRRNQYTVTTRTRPSDYLKAATLCLLSVIYIRTIKRSIVRPIVRSIVRLPSRDNQQLVVPPCMTGGTSPAYILATMPVYDPTELSPSNRVATVQRSLSRRNQYTVTTRTRPSDYLKAATLCLLSVIYLRTIKRSIVRPIVRSIVRLPSRDHPQLVVPPCMTGGTSPAYILATMPVYDPTELSPSNRVATVQRSLSRRNQYTVTTRTRPSDYLKAATLCLLSVIYMHHGAIWCLDTHQELQRL